MLKKSIVFITFVGVVVLAGLAVINKQQIKDYYVVSTTDVQPAAASIQSSIKLTGKGDFLYEASRPQVLSSSAFNAACKNVAEEHSVILGCYTNQRFYVYSIDDARLDGVEEVTAAHELLHAVYERMTTTEQQTIDKQLVAVANTIQDEHFKETVEAYRKAESGQLNNELHSILGTEIAVLPATLEQHYAQYFSDRQTIVAYSNQYQEIFRESERQRDVYEAQRTTLKSQIDQINQQIDDLQKTLNSKQQELQALRSTSVAAYNAQVPTYNALISDYNTLIDQVKRYIATYNDIIAKENALAVTQNELQQLLDSNYQTK
ncbi:hypothetical protein KC973_02135 [Candidatus Saccharibacteria bacterium]|nr:hypothetical protein [Candidatus Saccharibacteria bacterium]